MHLRNHTAAMSITTAIGMTVTKVNVVGSILAAGSRYWAERDVEALSKEIPAVGAFDKCVAELG